MDDSQKWSEFLSSHLLANIFVAIAVFLINVLTRYFTHLLISITPFITKALVLLIFIAFIFYLCVSVNNTLKKYGIKSDYINWRHEPQNPRVSQYDRTMFTSALIVGVFFVSFVLILSMDPIIKSMTAMLQSFLELTYQTIWIPISIILWRATRNYLNSKMRKDNSMVNEFAIPYTVDSSTS